MLLCFAFVSYLLSLSLQNEISNMLYQLGRFLVSCHFWCILLDLCEICFNPASCLLAYLTTYMFIVQYRVGIVALSLSLSLSRLVCILFQKVDDVLATVYVDPDAPERLQVVVGAKHRNRALELVDSVLLCCQVEVQYLLHFYISFFFSSSSSSFLISNVWNLLSTYWKIKYDTLNIYSRFFVVAILFLIKSIVFFFLNNSN